MDNSFGDHESATQNEPKRFLVRLTLLASIIKWLAGLIHLTEEEREDAGVYIDRLGDE
jgi:hypothetical protein